MPKKLTYAHVENYFNEFGYKLITREYGGNLSTMVSLCPMKHKCVTTWNGFKMGNRCQICSGHRLSYEHVVSYFKDRGCELLSNSYINNSTLMQYRCECENIAKIRFSDFQLGKRCRKCGNEKLSKAKRFSYEYVKKYFEEYNCILLSNVYVNNNSKLAYKCHCGNKNAFATFSSFQQGHSCKLCGQEKTAKQLRCNYDHVYNIFKMNDCMLLEEEYKNCDTLMEYICSCGENYRTSLYNFINGDRCKKCRYEKISGENSYRWAGGITDLYHFLRERISDWKDQVLLRHNYKCFITGQGGSLEIHHIYSFNKIVKEILDDLKINYQKNVGEYNIEQIEDILNIFKSRHTIDLGVPLIPSVHKLYHRIYNNNNDNDQFEEFCLDVKSGKYSNELNL